MERLQVDMAGATVSLPVAGFDSKSTDAITARSSKTAGAIWKARAEGEVEVEPEDLPGELLVAACRSFSRYISETPQEQQPQGSGLVAKESTPLPPPPATSEPSLSPPDTPRMVVEGELGPAGADGDELMEPPNIDFDDGRDSPYRYVHGAPLDNVAEGEEEE
jgi:hypothetical protein